MPERQKGLFYPDGNFKTDEQVKRKLALQGDLPQMRHLTPIKLPRDADELLEIASANAQQRKELAPQSENFVEVTLPPDSIVNLWGDLHLFNDETHHDRVRQELMVRFQVATR